MGRSVLYRERICLRGVRLGGGQSTEENRRKEDSIASLSLRLCLIVWLVLRKEESG